MLCLWTSCFIRVPDTIFIKLRTNLPVHERFTKEVTLWGTSLRS